MVEPARRVGLVGNTKAVKRSRLPEPERRALGSFITVIDPSSITGITGMRALAPTVARATLAAMSEVEKYVWRFAVVAPSWTPIPITGWPLEKARA